MTSWLIRRNIVRTLLFSYLIFILGHSALGQALTAGTINGTVTDPNNAVVSNATVTIENAVTGYTQTVATGPDGAFHFNNVPFNTYVVSASATGFSAAQQPLSVRTSVPISLTISLAIGSTTETVTISGGAGVLENVPSAHTDLDKNLINRLPVQSPGNGLSDVVTLAAPGIVADSNGFMHPLGDHAEVNLSLDNQPISDQQSKAFSTQIPLNAIQSMEVVTGAAPAEYGDKTSLVINAITRSGLNQTKPTGSFNALYGTFGTTHEDAALAYGNAKGGNFVALNFERSGRFLDAPEFTVLHDRGKALNVFDRVDYSPNSNDTFHLNLFLAGNRFETPDEFDQQAIGQDQRQLVNTLNIAPGYVHIFSPTTVLSINPYYRVDSVKYSSSPDPFSDQPITFNQSRRLNNVGIKSDLSYVKGRNNAKFGVQFSHTFLNEGFQFGITDPEFNDPASPDFLPGLLQFDLTRSGTSSASTVTPTSSKRQFLPRIVLLWVTQQSYWVCVSTTIMESPMPTCGNRVSVSLI
jgi:hypothetical protein